MTARLVGTLCSSGELVTLNTTRTELSGIGLGRSDLDQKGSSRREGSDRGTVAPKHRLEYTRIIDLSVCQRARAHRALAASTAHLLHLGLLSFLVELDLVAQHRCQW